MCRQDLLVRAGGGRLFELWLEDSLAAPDSLEYLLNGYIPKSAWDLLYQSPGLTLALLKDGGGCTVLCCHCPCSFCMLYWALLWQDSCS